MKIKCFLLLMLFIINVNFIYPILFNENERGQYTYYHYNVKDVDCLIGFYYIEKNAYLLRIYNNDNNKAYAVLIDIIKKNKDYEIIPGKAAGDLSPELFMRVLTLIFNLAERYKRIDVKEFPKDIFINENLGDEFENKFSYWIPIFNLNYLKNKTQNSYVLKLIKFGKSNDDNLKDFLDFKKIPTAKEDGPKLKISNKKTTKIKLYDTILLLDDNWEKMPDQMLKEISINKGYFINIASNRDAQINVEEAKFNKNNYIAPEDIIKIGMINLQRNSYIYPETIEIKIINNVISCSFKAIDLNTMINNFFSFNFKKISKYEYNVINFSCFYSVYDNNKEYFKLILSSIK